MNWIKLVDISEDRLWRGTVFQFKAGYPFEDQIVMMLCQFRDNNKSLSLVTVTGYSAGIDPYVIFPHECLIDEKSLAISKKWLIDNWSKWVIPEGNVEDVWIKERLDVSEIIFNKS